MRIIKAVSLGTAIGNMLRNVAVLLLFTFASHIACAGLLQYEWSGYVNDGIFTPEPPAGHSSDPAHSIPFTISVSVDSLEIVAETEIEGSSSNTGGPSFHYDYEIVLTSLTIDGEPQHLSHSEFSIRDNAGVNQWDVLRYVAFFTYNNESIWFASSIHFDGSTFTLQDPDVAPVFGSAVPVPNNVLSWFGWGRSFTPEGTQATAQILPVPVNVPMPFFTHLVLGIWLLLLGHKASAGRPATS